MEPPIGARNKRVKYDPLFSKKNQGLFWLQEQNKGLHPFLFRIYCRILEFDSIIIILKVELTMILDVCTTFRMSVCLLETVWEKSEANP